MDEIVEQLIEVISREIEAFQRLLQTLHQKQRAIVEGEIGRLNEHVQTESKLANETKTLEAERLRRTRELAQSLSMEDLNPKLSQIIQKVEKKYAQRLAEQRELLRGLAQKIQNLNKNNQFLLDYSLKFIEENMRLLLSSNDQFTVYKKDGKLQTESVGKKVVDHSL
ncbi:MAG: flagellar protein FlgN [Calditrichaeota bacterium]|nr:MAG: flagellar protein FlgN [Calditrichota bacterium]